MNDILKIGKYGLLSGEAAGESANKAYGELLKAQVGELSEYLEAANTALSKINHDPELSDRGKAEHFNRAAEAARAKVKELTAARRRKLDLDLEQAQKAVPTELPVTVRRVAVSFGPDMPGQLADALRAVSDAVSAGIREGEIRNVLASKDPVQREAIVKGAADVGDLETLLAVQNAPKLIPLVSRKTLGEATQTYLKQAFPDAFEKVDVVQRAITLYEQNAKQAEKAVGMKVRPAPPDTKGIKTVEPTGAAFN